MPIADSSDGVLKNLGEVTRIRRYDLLLDGLQYITGIVMRTLPFAGRNSVLITSACSCIILTPAQELPQSTPSDLSGDINV